MSNFVEVVESHEDLLINIEVRLLLLLGNCLLLICSAIKVTL